jgi:hypothetical protein
MPIKTGIGIGEAQVFDTKDIVDTFYKQYQLQQKQDQLFAEKIADQLSKFDTSGLTGKDLERATGMYDKVKNFNQSISNLSGSKKAVLEAQIRKGMNDIKTFSANAKQFYKDREAFGVEYAKDKYSFVPELAPTIDKLTTLSYGEALDNNLADINSLRMKRTPDDRLVEDSLKDMYEAVKRLSDDTKPIPVTQNGITTIYHIADPKAVDGVVLSILAEPAKKFNWVDNFKRANPEAPTPNDTELSAFIKKTYEARNGGPGGAYKFKTGESKAATGGSGKEPSSSDSFVLAANNAFSRNKELRDRYLNQIRAHSKARVSDIVYNADGTLTLIPFVKSKFTGKMKVGDPIKLNSPIDLVNQLGGLGITQSGFDVVTGLNQTAQPKQTPPAPKGTNYVKFVLNGDTYEIPSNMADKFKRQNPTAKRK